MVADQAAHSERADAIGAHVAERHGRATVSIGEHTEGIAGPPPGAERGLAKFFAPPTKKLSARG